MASDDFNRADANPLDGNWTKPTAGLTGALKIVSNAVLNSAASTDSAAYHSVSTVADSQVKVTVISNGDGGPGIHMDASGNGYILNGSSGNLILYKVTGGTFSSLSPFASGTTYAANDVARVRRSGNDLIVSLNGATLFTVVSETTFTGGAPGMHMFDGTISFDDWTDNAGGGPPPDPAIDIIRNNLRPRAFAPGLAR